MGAPAVPLMSFFRMAKKKRALNLVTAGILLALSLAAATPEAGLLAPTPPMGWNSWDSFGTTVTEDEVKANADYMAKNLKAHGWQYIVVDIQWSELHPKTHGYRPNAELNMDEFGRLIPAPNRFPSAANGQGFKPLADYVHAKGLKFGIHIMRGIPRRAVEANLPILNSKLKASEVANKQSLCPWNTDMYGVDTTRGGQDYYASTVQLYASWGVDFIKADDMFGFGPNGDHSTEIEAMGSAIRKCERPIVLSLSPGTRDASHAEFVVRHAQMWRISNDFWDRWVDLKAQFKRFDLWSPYAGPGHWPDGDMLPLGHIGIRAERGNPRMSLLTHDEQLTLMTLWSIARSPLMFGGHLPDNDDFTLSLLANDEVLAVNQKVQVSKQLFLRGEQVAWVAAVPDSPAKYLAVFNTGDSGEEKVNINWRDLGLPSTCSVRDLWSKHDLGAVRNGREFALQPHAAGFYKIAPVQ
jgi:alpha-galactosidase